MLKNKFPQWPQYSREEARLVADVLKTGKVNYLVHDRLGPEFEKKFAKWCGTRYAVALSNGTVALELALKALGLGPGDEVIVTARTFVASVSCILSVGAKPVFADVDPDSQNITADSIREVLTKKTRAVICVHLAGWPCEMSPILKLARQKKLKVIEDCAQAHGAKYKGKSVGSLGHVAAWSFCQDKIISTGGEGGMITTNDRSLWSKIWAFKDHGKSFDLVEKGKHSPGYLFSGQVESIGTNGRLTEMQSALGIYQLGKVKGWSRKRRINYEKIMNTCRKLPGLRVPEVPKHIDHAGYRAYVFVRPEKLKKGWNQEKILKSIYEKGIPCGAGACPEVYLEEAYKNLRPKKRLPIAQKLGETSLMFFIHPTLRVKDIELMCRTLREVMAQATQ